MVYQEVYQAMTDQVAEPADTQAEPDATAAAQPESSKEGFFGLSGGEMAKALGLPHEDANKEPSKPSADTDATPDPEPKSESFMFAGKEYKSQAAAEQALRVFRGQARSGTERTRALEAEVARLKAQPTAQPKPTPTLAKGDSPAPTPVQVPARGEDSLLGLTNDDLIYVNQLFKEGRTADANLYILAKQEAAIDARVGKVEKSLRDEFKTQIDRIGEPEARRQQDAKIEAQAIETLRAGLEAVDPETDAPVYPELHEEAHLDSFIQTWRELTEGDESGAMPLDFALTPAGRHFAYLYWKAHRYAAAEGEAEPQARLAPTPAPTLAQRGRISAPVALRSAPSRAPLQPQAPKNPIERAFTREDQAHDELI